MKISWGHGVIIALGAFMLFILGMIFLFPIGKQNSELITNNYYEEELHYQEVIDAKNRADSLAQKPEVKLTNAKGIEVFFPKEINNANAKIEFHLFRTNDSNLDVKKVVKLDPNNAFTIPKSVIQLGNYTLKVKWTKDKLDYQRDFDIEWK